MSPQTVARTPAKAKPKPAAEQAPISSLTDHQLSPIQSKFYFETLEILVLLYFGGKALHHVESFSRSKARKARRAFRLWTGTITPVLLRMLEEKGKLYPNNLQRSPQAAKGGPR